MDHYRGKIEAELEKDVPNQSKMAFWLAQLDKLEANQVPPTLPGNLHPHPILFTFLFAYNICIFYI
jgi:hypothetical protein